MLQHLLDTLTGAHNFIIKNAKIIALAYLNTVHHAIAHGHGHAAAGSLLSFLSHHYSVLIQAACSIKMQERCQALRHIRCRHKGYLGIAKQLAHLLRCQNNILIIGQDDILLAGAVFDSLHKILHRGIHALAATDDFGCAHLVHDTGDALACSDS